MKRLFAVCTALATFVAYPAPASARTLLERAAAAVENRWIYVDPPARGLLAPADERRLRARLAARKALPSKPAPVYVVVIRPTDADAETVVRALARSMGQRGTYAVLGGDTLAAYSDAYPPYFAAALARQAAREKEPVGPAAILSEFIRVLEPFEELPDPNLGPDGSEDVEDPAGPFVRIMLGVGGVAVAFSIWAERRRRRFGQRPGVGHRIR